MSSTTAALNAEGSPSSLGGFGTNTAVPSSLTPGSSAQAAAVTAEVAFSSLLGPNLFPTSALATPSALGPRAIVHLLIGPGAARTYWPQVHVLLTGLVRHIADIHRQSNDRDVAVLLDGKRCCLADPDAEACLTHEQDGRFSSSEASNRALGPLLPVAFLVLAQGCLATDPTCNGDDSVERVLSGLSSTIDASKQQQEPYNSRRQAMMPPAPPVVARYFVTIFAGDDLNGNQGQMTAKSRELAQSISQNCEGVLSIRLAPPKSSPEDAASSGSHPALDALHSELGQNLERPEDSRLEEIVRRCLSNSHNNANKTPPPLLSEKTSLEILGFHPPQLHQQRLESKKRSRDEANSREDASDKRLKTEDSQDHDGEAQQREQQQLSQAQPKPAAPPSFWSGSVSWEVQVPNGGVNGKRPVKLWVSAVGARTSKSTTAGLASSFCLPWPSTLPFSILQPISWPHIGAYLSKTEAPLIALHPRLPAGFSAPGDTIPQTSEELLRNDHIYLSLATTLESKQSAAWLNLRGLKDDLSKSRSSPGILVVSKSEISGKSRIPARLLGIVFPTGAPWEQLQSPEQSARSEQLQQREAQSALSSSSLLQRRQRAANAQTEGSHQNQTEDSIPSAPTESLPPMTFAGGATQPTSAAAMANLPAQTQQALLAMIQQRQQQQQQQQHSGGSQGASNPNSVNLAAAAQAWLASQQKQQAQNPSGFSSAEPSTLSAPPLRHSQQPISALAGLQSSEQQQPQNADHSADPSFAGYSSFLRGGNSVEGDSALVGSDSHQPQYHRQSHVPQSQPASQSLQGQQGLDFSKYDLASFLNMQ